MIIAIANPAGQPSSAALTCNLAVLRARTGRRLCIVDLDARHRCGRWCADRGVAGLVPWIATRNTGYRDLKHDLRLLTRQFNDVLVHVDAPDTRQGRYALAAAALVVLPVDPRALDLSSQYALKGWLAAARDFNPALRVLLVPLCQATAFSEDDLGEMRAFATRLVAARLAGTAISSHQGHDYGAGRCVCDAQTCDAAEAAEMQALYRDVYQHFEADRAMVYA